MAADVWTTLAMADRWAELAVAWLASPRLPGLVGTRDQAGKGINALAPELSRCGASAPLARSALRRGLAGEERLDAEARHDPTVGRAPARETVRTPRL